MKILYSTQFIVGNHNSHFLYNHIIALDIINLIFFILFNYNFIFIIYLFLNSSHKKIYNYKVVKQYFPLLYYATHYYKFCFVICEYYTSDGFVGMENTVKKLRRSDDGNVPGEEKSGKKK